MPMPLFVTDAISRAEQWWQASEVVRVFPDENSVTEFFGEHSALEINGKGSTEPGYCDILEFVNRRGGPEQ